ncbi:unnamed protein product, partial [Nesidiocoris tenuis]
MESMTISAMIWPLNWCPGRCSMMYPLNLTRRTANAIAFLIGLFHVPNAPHQRRPP